jgi:hypothetical protein
LVIGIRLCGDNCVAHGLFLSGFPGNDCLPPGLRLPSSWQARRVNGSITPVTGKIYRDRKDFHVSKQRRNF